MLAVFIIFLPLVELESVHGGNSMIGARRPSNTVRLLLCQKAAHPTKKLV
jgi:hypothetical protein